MLPDEVRECDPHPLATGPTKWRAEHCTTHHYACNCREWEHACELERWQARAERAEAVLREFKQALWLAVRKFGPIRVTHADLVAMDPERMTIEVSRDDANQCFHITAYLSENSRG